MPDSPNLGEISKLAEAHTTKWANAAHDVLLDKEPDIPVRGITGEHDHAEEAQENERPVRNIGIAHGDRAAPNDCAEDFAHQGNTTDQLEQGAARHHDRFG